VTRWLKLFGPLVLVVPFSGCDEEETITYTLFNCEEDSTFVRVGEERVVVGDDCDGDELLQLNSSSCEVSVGQATVSPCGGPIGTEHEIVVKVNSTYSHEISKVTAVLESGQRGEESYTLTPDSADEGLYKVTLISVGSENEQRDDLLRIKLWKEDPESSED
tara:strand:- start:862 stop:1347 length:486 start_codon:yes stop_codon:yes gene_type:complete